DRGCQLQRALEKAWQRDSGLPVDFRRESPGEHPRRFNGRIGNIAHRDRDRLIAFLFDQVERIGPGESANSQRRLESRRRMPDVGFYLDTVGLAERVRDVQKWKLVALIGVKNFVRRE